jgi:hypothetical protein
MSSFEVEEIIMKCADLSERLKNYSYFHGLDFFKKDIEEDLLEFFDIE